MPVFPAQVPFFSAKFIPFPSSCVRKCTFPGNTARFLLLKEAIKDSYCIIVLPSQSLDVEAVGVFCKVLDVAEIASRQTLIMTFRALFRCTVGDAIEIKIEHNFCNWKPVPGIPIAPDERAAADEELAEFKKLFAEFVHEFHLSFLPQEGANELYGRGVLQRALQHLDNENPNPVEMVDDIMNFIGAISEKAVRDLLSDRLHHILTEAKIRDRISKACDILEIILYGDEKPELIAQSVGPQARQKSGNKQEDYRKRFGEIKQFIPKEKWPQIEREITYAKGDTANAQVSQRYLDHLLWMPWGVYTQDAKDLVGVQKILDEDHAGLMKVKDQILKFLSIRRMNPSAKGSILCLVGPPGVGKTSIGKSVARALGRKFARMALGGVHDEAELRGHRRTYIGADWGKIAAKIHDVGSFNPLFAFDEIDKVGSHLGHENVASALLEVLDPEQNSAFDEHYLDVPLDLSHGFFLTTANLAEPILPALLDRMTVIHISGYTPQEKLVIATKHLIPKQRTECGIPIDQDGKKLDVIITESAVRDIIQHYTAEAGVRELEKQIHGILGGIDKDFLMHPEKYSAEGVVEITPQNLHQWCDRSPRRDHAIPAILPQGVVPALGVTNAGGHVFLFEISLGDQYQERKIKLTGVRAPHDQKESVNKIEESLQIAFGHFSSRTGILYERIRTLEAEHPLYVQGNLTDDAPKDGPSAGVAAAIALYSALTETPVSASLAATGAISLSGAVSAVGGIRDKVLAAHRAGVRRVILPKENEQDIEEIPEDVRSEMKLVPVSTIREALRIAFPDDPLLK
ncbi:MAG: AAA family ATPase [Candidatus Niyogibacteria bacterium]|nr:AAA family ATPase [Candidatus Niyogibacteria bacterium]